MADESTPVADVDVCVIGAGLSGLACADRLRTTSELSVVVLDARDRVGGRVHTVSESDSTRWVDLGGMWINPKRQKRMGKLARDLNVPIFPQNTSGKTVVNVDGEIYRRSSTFFPYASPFDLILSVVRIARLELHRRRVPLDAPWEHPNALELDSVTVDSFFGHGTRSQRVANVMTDCFVNVVFGCEARELSQLWALYYINAGQGVLSLANATDGAQEMRFFGGTEQVARRLADRIGRDHLHLGADVAHIDQTDECALVRTSDGRTIRAKYVVCACSPTVCRRIRFSPSLPGVREQLCQRMFKGHTIKVVVTYEHAFWRDDGLSGEALSNTGPLSVVYDYCQPDARNPALVGFIVADRAREWGQRSRDDRQTAVVQALVDCFGDQARDFGAYYEKDWSLDDVSGGCPVSNFGPGGLTGFGVALREPCGRVHWAGTETATEWVGFMEGAVQAGERAADEVVIALRSASEPVQRQSDGSFKLDVPSGTIDRTKRFWESLARNKFYRSHRRSKWHWVGLALTIGLPVVVVWSAVSRARRSLPMLVFRHVVRAFQQWRAGEPLPPPPPSTAS